MYKASEAVIRNLPKLINGVAIKEVCNGGVSEENFFVSISAIYKNPPGISSAIRLIIGMVVSFIRSGPAETLQG